MDNKGTNAITCVDVWSFDKASIIVAIIYVMGLCVVVVMVVFGEFFEFGEKLEGFCLLIW